MSLAHAAMLPRRVRQLANEIGVTLDGPRPPLKPAPSPPGLRCVVLVGRLGHLGHAPRGSNGQSRLPANSSTWSVSWANAVTDEPARGHAVCGMQGVRVKHRLAAKRPSSAWFAPRRAPRRAAKSGRSRITTAGTTPLAGQ
jgi:hypothetical protein